MYITSAPPVKFPRETSFVGCKNEQGIEYGSLVPDAEVPEEYRVAVLELRDFFIQEGATEIRVDVVRFDDDSPVIQISGEPGEAFRRKYNATGSALEEPSYWQAIYKIIDPFEVDLNPYLEFVPGIRRGMGFYDASKS